MLIKIQASMFVVISLLLTPITPMTANGQENQTFDPLPEGAQILSEKNGERTVKLKNGVVLGLSSKQKQEKIKNELGYTAEQIRNSLPAEIVVPDGPNPTPQAVPQTPEINGPPVSAPSTAPKKK